MADEEQSFTFVDKRRAAAETPAADAAISGAEPIMEMPEASDLPATDEAQDGPSDIYSVLGYCMSILASEAWQMLGLIADQRTGEAKQDLAQAKVAIDAAGELGARLEAAPPEFVPDALKRDLRTLLQDLRLNYVSQQGQSIGVQQTDFA